MDDNHNNERSALERFDHNTIIHNNTNGRMRTLRPLRSKYWIFEREGNRVAMDTGLER